MFFDVKLENPEYRPVELDRFYDKDKSVDNLIHKIISTSDRIVHYYDKLFSRLGFSISLEKQLRNGLICNDIVIDKIKRKLLFFTRKERLEVSNLLNEFYTDLHSRYLLTTPFDDAELINKDCAKAYMYAVLIIRNDIIAIGEEQTRYREMCSDYINLVGLLNIVNNIGKVPLGDDFNGEYLNEYLGIPKTHVRKMNGVIIKILTNYMMYYSPIVEIIVCNKDRTSVKGQLNLSSCNYNELKLLDFLKENLYSQVVLFSRVN